MKRWLPMALLLMLTGCIGAPKEFKEKATIQQTAALAATRNADLEQKIVSAPPPTIVTSSNPRTGEVSTTITPAPAVTTTKYHEGMQVEGEESGKSWYSLTESIPLGVKLIFIGLAIALFLGIWAYVRRVSLAARTMGETADQVLAQQIQRIRNKAILSTDHEDLAAHTAEIAILEAERGKLAGKKK